MVRYVSTRGGDRTYTFEQAILAGWAHNGGLILPDPIPVLSQETIESWRGLHYSDLTFEIMRRFIPDEEMSDDELRGITSKCFSRFGTSSVVPITPVTVDGEFRINVAELWHGPTLAFKDLGMQVLGPLIDHFLTKRGDRLTILIGTSGDTGSAGIEAVRGAKSMDAIVLFPDSRISEIQKLQMTSVGAVEENITTWGVDGTSDDIDRPLMQIFADTPFRDAHKLGSINSVNVGRLLVQVIQFFHGYLQCGKPGERVRFAVPTGAGGHVVGGFIAKQMGLDAEFLIATNENDIFHRMIHSGDLTIAETVVKTNSPAMDIQLPYNIERIFYLLYKDTEKVRTFMEAFYKGEATKLDDDFPEMVRAAFNVTSMRASNEQVEETIRKVHANAGYLLDPHTAVGVAGASATRTPATTVCMACAHPAKFPDTMARIFNISNAEAVALIPNQDHPCVSRVLALLGKAFNTRVLAKGEDWEKEIRTLVESVTKKRTL